VDDALSAQRLPDGRLQLGVHIADVSAFVRQASLRQLYSCLPVQQAPQGLPDALSFQWHLPEVATIDTCKEYSGLLCRKRSCHLQHCEPAPAGCEQSPTVLLQLTAGWGAGQGGCGAGHDGLPDRRAAGHAAGAAVGGAGVAAAGAGPARGVGGVDAAGWGRRRGGRLFRAHHHPVGILPTFHDTLSRRRFNQMK
jgi:hypothetical protein